MKKFGTALICGLVMVLFGIVGIILPVGDGIITIENVTGKANVASKDSGYSYIFGNDSTNMAPGLLTAWIFLLVALLAGVAAVVLVFLKKDKKVANFSGTGLLFACGGLFAFIAGILFFCAKPLSGLSDNALLIYKLGAGFVVGAICALVSGLAGIAAFVVPTFLKK
jgi:hypothetical protein